MTVLGLSAHYHDAAAAVVRDGAIVCAAQEERFSRVKHDARLPERAARWCLEAAGIGPDGPDLVAFYDRPIAKFDRVMTTFAAVAPRGTAAFVAAVPEWARSKLWVRLAVERLLAGTGRRADVEVRFVEHHHSHAASAFLASPFASAAILTVDGVGEWATTTLGRGEGTAIRRLGELRFPHSLGLLYSAATAHCGFRVNDGEYQLMGLAALGRPALREALLAEVVDLKADGSLALNMEYFGWLDSLRMTTPRWDRLAGGPARRPGDPLLPRHADLAASVQAVTEEALLRMARHLHALTGESRLVMAGGVALNCVANGRIVRESPFREVWTQPAAGDAGGAPGAALAAWAEAAGTPVRPATGVDGMRAARLGPVVGEAEADATLAAHGLAADPVAPEELPDAVAKRLASGRIVGLCAGAMEFGPRALGGRSILADPRDPATRDRLNARIKHRESFRPFAPAVLAEDAAEWFDLDRPSPYMLLTAPVRPDRRARIPAVTHLDGSARVQTVTAGDHPELHAVLSAWKRGTGVPVLLNTSFNGADEPIVATATDAVRCALRIGLDDLVLGSRIVGLAGGAA